MVQSYIYTVLTFDAVVWVQAWPYIGFEVDGCHSVLSCLFLFMVFESLSEILLCSSSVC